MQTLFLQVISQHAVLLWHHLSPIIDACVRLIHFIGVGTLIAFARWLYARLKNRETFPGYCKLQAARQRLCSLWSRLKSNLINFLRRYMRR